VAAAEAAAVLAAAPCSRGDPVAGLGQRLDDRRVAELAPQPADRHLDRARERVGHLVPHPLQQFLGRDHPPLRGEQQLEHAELLRSQVQRSASPARAPPRRVEPQVTVLQHRRERRLGPAQQCPQPRHELGECERLGQVVVGAEAESVHPVLDGRRGGQHQHPAAPPGPHQLGAHLVTVPPGQVPVQHDHVVVGDQRALEALRPVVGHVHRHPLLPQPGPDRVGQLTVVLDHQHPHARPPFTRLQPPASATSPASPQNLSATSPPPPRLPTATQPPPSSPPPGCTPVTRTRAVRDRESAGATL